MLWHYFPYTHFYHLVSLQGESLPSGHQFMIDLLVGSLMADQGLENALITAIAYEVQDPATVLKPGVESSVPLLLLVQQLVGNSSSRQMALLKRVRNNIIYSPSFFLSSHSLYSPPFSLPQPAPLSVSFHLSVYWLNTSLLL